MFKKYSKKVMNMLKELTVEDVAETLIKELKCGRKSMHKF